jgi:hypothetical protein
MSQNAWKPLLIEGTAASQGTSTYNELVVSGTSLGKRYIRIQRIIIVPANDGSATTYQPTISTGDGISGAIGQLYLGSSTGIGDIFDVTDIQGYGVTDANGSLWLAFIPDAGSDNTFSYQVYLDVF